MIAYLIVQKGPYKESIFSLEEGQEWTFGRDPEANTFALSDPTVSRKHARIFLDDGSYYLENLSTINPLLVNGEEVTAPTQLQEEDIIEIGNNTLKFTLHLPKKDATPKEEGFKELNDVLPQLTLTSSDDSRWLVKVIAGPNSGAEFGIKPNESFVLGKDPDAADIVFQDLSVSRYHAKIFSDENGLIFIEDLGSKNGVFVNGAKVEGSLALESQDLVSLGTTSFLVIDREQTRETIYSPAAAFTGLVKPEKEELKKQKEEEAAAPRNWKELFIPKRHLVFASIFSITALLGIASMVSLFRVQPVTISSRDEAKEIQAIVKKFPTIEFSFNESEGTLFLVGHLLTEIDKSELFYLLGTLPFIQSIEDNTVIDEFIWTNLNALISKNPKWRSILVTAPKPGNFVMRGYLETMEDVAELAEYVNRNFSYLSKLSNEVVVENNLQIEVQNILISEGFTNVTFQFSSGELIVSGRANAGEESAFNKAVSILEAVPGVRVVRNFVIFTGESSSKIDLSKNYTVMGTSKYGDVSQFVLINGRILSDGDILDGMRITSIDSYRINLEKDGIKYKIDFNNQ
ncbi:MAG: EscD/YscD/HrpQ family type III secretion system inner membrane ring protein [Chlamydiae bacterium]|nr:EscD/YscD/HrpQ family type III secretion system inner membrane ring protein [Chlamydiota bacterium]